MKIILTNIFILLVFSAFGQTATLELTVTNFEEDKGHLIVSVFNNAEDFPIRNKHYARIIVDIEDIESTSLEIELPHGDYAIALLHDRNKDDECNFNFIGIPTEAYGFSQNIRPIIKVPSFEETKFNMQENQSMEIRLIN